MEINKEVISTLKEKLGDEHDIGLAYLLCVYYGLRTDYIPNIVAVTVNIMKIVDVDNSNNLIWNVPLFTGGTVVNTPFDWVISEYVALFEPIGKATNAKEALVRMKSLFSENPEVRKEDVLEATKIYLRSTDPKYVRAPHYFISKGSGVNKIQDILTWIDTYKKSVEVLEITNSDNTRKFS